MCYFCEIQTVPLQTKCLDLKYSLFLLDTAGHTRTRRGPDVVHHCFKSTSNSIRSWDASLAQTSLWKVNKYIGTPLSIKKEDIRGHPLRMLSSEGRVTTMGTLWRHEEGGQS